ncbi:MAG: glucose-6-phosphate isomerase [Sulfurovum sp.]|nr:glucose-6-phosphate isomerase [Sulfurovum sp.]
MNYSKNFYQIRSNEHILSQLKKEREKIGYYDLPFADTSNIKTFAQKVTQCSVAILGVGGSSLGSSAIYNFLKRKYHFKKDLFFFETTDPIDIKDKLDRIDPDNTFFIIISKSGTTVETISIFKYLSAYISFHTKNTAIISKSDTPLYRYAKENTIPFFNLAQNIGGRFSVFSVVGLLPLAIIGVDIDNMLKGAQKVYHSFFNHEQFYQILMEKARFFVENKNRFKINVLFSYSSSLKDFNKWYVQLWAESLGKYNINGTKQGLTPIGLIGPVDQHSFLQLIMEGVRDKTVTFIKVADFEEKIIIPSHTTIPELEYLEKVSFSKLIDLQADATIEAIATKEDIPYDVITIDKVDEYNIAELMYSYELLTSIIGAFLQINTYNQPGVEIGKNILKQKLKSFTEYHNQ